MDELDLRWQDVISDQQAADLNAAFTSIFNSNEDDDERTDENEGAH